MSASACCERGELVVGVAEQAQAPAADASRCRSARSPRRRCPAGPAARNAAGRPQRPGRRGAEQRIDHQVDGPVAGAGEPPRQLGHVPGVQPGHGVGPAALSPFGRAVGPAARDHPPRAAQPRGLHRDLAHRAAPAEHDDLLTRVQLTGHVTAIQAATADRPRAATSSGFTSKPSGTRSASATEQHSRRLPSPGTIPARVQNHAIVPGRDAGRVQHQAPRPARPARTASPAARSRTCRWRTADPAA